MPARRHAAHALLLALGTAPLLPAQGGALFDRVAELLGDEFHDRAFRSRELPQLVAALRPRALAAPDGAAERDVVQSLLERVPSSHLALYSAATHRHLLDELAGKAAPTFGCTLVRLRDAFFVDGVLDDGPAARAGLRRGDRVVAIDGAEPAASARLDWRADDAWLADPPLHPLLAELGAELRLAIETQPGARRDVVVAAAPYSAYAASCASVRTLSHRTFTFGYLHLWLVFQGKSTSLVRNVRKRFGGLDGIVFDLRGRGGSGADALAIVRELAALRDRGMPMVFLIDEGTRSAKEVIAWEIRDRQLGLLVGERTAGAVVPASFEAVGSGAVLMFPRATLGDYTRTIEGIGVAPHRSVADALPYAHGADPILADGLQALGELATVR